MKTRRAIICLLCVIVIAVTVGLIFLPTPRDGKEGLSLQTRFENETIFFEIQNATSSEIILSKHLLWNVWFRSKGVNVARAQSGFDSLTFRFVEEQIVIPKAAAFGLKKGIYSGRIKLPPQDLPPPGGYGDGSYFVVLTQEIDPDKDAQVFELRCEFEWSR